MKFINFNGDKLSKLSLGTVQFGLDYGISNKNGQPSQTDVNKIIDYIFEKNINCFDTAQAYGNSEEVLGKAIKRKKNLFIISKLKSDVFKENAIKNLDKSLEKLKITSLYALLLHDSELLFNWTDKYTLIVEELKKSQKIKYFGVSIYNNEDFELAINNESIEFIQIPFNIFDQRAITERWFEKAKQANKLIFIRSIFLQGLLFMNKEEIPKNLKKAEKEIEKFEKYCEDLNMNRGELALNFVDSVASNALILFGCDSLEQAKKNIENYNLLKKLDKNVITSISESFRSIDELIYNPIKW